MEKHELLPRISHGDRYPELSRDWEDVDCKATGCRYNKYEKCMVPSRCKISSDGKCEGFEAPVFQTKVDGD